MALTSKQPPPLYPPRRQSLEALAREAADSQVRAHWPAPAFTNDL